MELLILVVLMLVLLTPAYLGMRARKRQALEAAELQESLQIGDRLMTTSGVLGTAVGLPDDETIELEIAPGVVTTWMRAAIRERIPDRDAFDAGADADADVDLRKSVD